MKSLEQIFDIHRPVDMRALSKYMNENMADIDVNQYVNGDAGKGVRKMNSFDWLRDSTNVLCKVAAANYSTQQSPKVAAENVNEKANNTKGELNISKVAPDMPIADTQYTAENAQSAATREQLKVASMIKTASALWKVAEGGYGSPRAGGSYPQNQPANGTEKLYPNGGYSYSEGGEYVPYDYAEAKRMSTREDGSIDYTMYQTLTKKMAERDAALGRGREPYRGPHDPTQHSTVMTPGGPVVTNQSRAQLAATPGFHSR